MVVSPVPATSHSLLGEPVFWFSHTTAFAVHPAPCANTGGADQRSAPDSTTSAASADRPRTRFARREDINGKPFDRDTRGYDFPTQRLRHVGSDHFIRETWVETL